MPDRNKPGQDAVQSAAVVYDILVTGDTAPRPAHFSKAGRWRRLPIKTLTDRGAYGSKRLRIEALTIEKEWRALGLYRVVVL